MTPETAAIELLERALPNYPFTHEGRPDIGTITLATPRLSAGEQIIVDIALALWQGKGPVADVGRYLDRDKRALILGLLSAVWLVG